MATLLELFYRFLIERGGSAILRERIALIEQQKVLAERRVAELEKEHAQLRAERDQLQRELASRTQAQEFVEGPSGALFKRGTHGAYVLAVYCPACRRPTASFPPGSGQFVCEPCRWFSDFEARELPRIVAALPPIS